MCDAVTASVVMGVMSAGLGIMQQQAQTRAQNAQIEFQNLQAEQEYEYNVLRTTAQRTTEDQKELLQEDLINQNIFLANEALESDVAQLNLELQQEQKAAGQSKRETAIAALEQKGEIIALGKGGNSVLNLIADVTRKQAAYDYATDVNLAFTGKQIQERKRGAGITAAGRRASQQPYWKQTYFDPLKPMKRPKVKGPGMLGFASAIAGGVSTGLGSYPGFKEAYG